VAGSNTTTWVQWVSPALTIVLAFVIAQLGVEVVRGGTVRLLDSLRSAHWTEQTRVFTEANTLSRLFRAYMLTMTTALVLYGQDGLGPRQLLRAAGLVTLLVMLTGDPLGARWVRRATAGQLTPLSWVEIQRFGLLMFPARWVLCLFAALAPERYDTAGWAWAASLLFTLSVVQAGGTYWVARAMGVLSPVPETVRSRVEAVAQAGGAPAPPVYELKFARANALALPLLGWMVFTSSALERLEPPALSAVAAHELGHLREPLGLKLLRVAGGVSLFFVMGFVPAFPEQPLRGFLYGCWLFIIVALGMRLLSRHLERRADALAHRHEAEPGTYVAALERLYQLNWVGAGVVNATHPSLYDRARQAGVQPDYERPKRPLRGARLLVLAFALVFSVCLAFIANPMLAGLLE
jgi:Zn-dependent protease with chaperone function